MSITQSPNHPNQPNHANHFNHANHPNHTNLIITSITPITPITSITLITNCKFFLLHLKNVITSITDGFFSENFWNSWSRQSQLIFLRFFWNTWSRQLRLSFFSQKDLKYVITSNTIHFLWKSPITKSRDYTITKNPKPPIWLASGGLQNLQHHHLHLHPLLLLLQHHLQTLRRSTPGWCSSSQECGPISIPALDVDTSNVNVTFYLDRAICDSIIQYFATLSRWML